VEVLGETDTKSKKISKNKTGIFKVKGEEKESESYGKENNSRVEHVGSIGNLSGAKGGDSGQKKTKVFMINIFADEIKKKGGKSKDKSKANPRTGGKRKKKGDGHDKPVIERAKVERSGRRRGTKKGQKVIVEGVSSDDGIAGLVLV